MTIRIILLRLILSWWFIPVIWAFYPFFWLITGDDTTDTLVCITKDIWYGLER